MTVTFTAKFYLRIFFVNLWDRLFLLNKNFTKKNLFPHAFLIFNIKYFDNYVSLNSRLNNIYLKLHVYKELINNSSELRN